MRLGIQTEVLIGVVFEKDQNLFSGFQSSICQIPTRLLCRVY